MNKLLISLIVCSFLILPLTLGLELEPINKLIKITPDDISVSVKDYGGNDVQYLELSQIDSKKIEKGFIIDTQQKNDGAKKYYLNLTINYEGRTVERDNRLILQDSGYKIYKGVRCLLYNETGGVYDAPVFKPVIEIKPDYIRTTYEIILDGPYYKFECIDPLVNETTPVIGYISKDGSNENANFKTFIGANSYGRNYTTISLGDDWANVTAENYDALVDVYYMQGGNDGPNFDLVNNTRGFLLQQAGESLWNAGYKYSGVGGICEDVRDINQDGVFNITNATHELFSWYGANPINIHGSVKASSGCEQGLIYVPPSQCYMIDDDDSTEITGCVLESGDPLNDTVTASRWITLPLSAVTYNDWADVYKNLTVKSFDWIVEPHAGGGPENNNISVTDYYNITTTNVSLELYGEANRTGNFTFFRMDNCGGSVQETLTNDTGASSARRWFGSLVNSTTYPFIIQADYNDRSRDNSSCFNVTTGDSPDPGAPPPNNNISITDYYNISISNTSLELYGEANRTGNFTFFRMASCGGAVDETLTNNTDATSARRWFGSLVNSTTYPFIIQADYNDRSRDNSSCFNVTTSDSYIPPPVQQNGTGLSYNPYLGDWFSLADTTALIDEVHGNNASIHICLASSTAWQGNSMYCISGQNRYALISKTAELNITGDWSVGFWANCTSGWSDWFRETVNPAGGIDGFVIQPTPTADLYITNATVNYVTDNQVCNLRWQYLMVTADQSDVTVYVNGSAVSTTETGSYDGWVHPAASNYYLGNYQSQEYTYMDNIGIYSRELSTGEVAEIAAANGNPLEIGITFRAYSAVTGAPILSYSIIIENGTNTSVWNTTTGFIWFNESSGTWNYTANASNYAEKTGSVSGGSYEKIYLSEGNSLTIYIYEEETGDPIYESVSITLAGENSSYENSTASGNITITDMLAGTYTGTFSADNYTTRFYEVTITQDSSSTLNVYLTNSTDTVIFTLINELTGNVVDGASMVISRLINASWTVVSSKSSDITGRIQFTYTADAGYKFLVTETGFSVKEFTLTPILFDEYDVLLTPSVSEIDSSDYAGISLYYSPTIYYENNVTEFSLTIGDPTGGLTAYEVNLTYPGGSNTSSGSNAYGETIDLLVYIGDVEIGDTVNISYGYESSQAGVKTFHASHFIVTGIGNTTIVDNRNEDYGMGALDRAMVGTLLTILIGGAATYFAGAIAGATLGMFALGYFAYINLWPLWAVIISLVVGFVLISWRSSR